MNKKLFSILFVAFASISISFAGSVVAGQYPFWAQYSGFTPDKVPYQLYTQIQYGYFTPGADATIQMSDGSDQENFQKLVSLSKKAGVQILAIVGGPGMSDSYPTIAASEELRTAFAKNVSGLVQEQGLDGVVLSWEFPSQEDAANLTALVKATKSALAGKFLTLAVNWDPAIAGAYEKDALASVDQVIVLAYDMMDENHSTVVPNASLPESQEAMERFGSLAGKEKVLLGTPLYARSFSKATGLGSSHDGFGSGNEGILSWAELVKKFDGKDYKTSVDEKTQSEVAVGNGETIVFNGIASTKARSEFVQKSGFGGMVLSDIISDFDLPSLSLAVTVNLVLRPDAKIK